MPRWGKDTPLTQKQENFCVAYVETGNASEAFRRAYDAENMNPASINRAAKKMVDNAKIMARVANLRQPIIQKMNITVEDLIRELEEARTIAMTCETPQSSAAIAATMGKAKLLGLDKQVLEVTGKDGGAIVTRVERVIVDAPR
ncbi:Terminase small subunit [compost metagenome]